MQLENSHPPDSSKAPEERFLNLIALPKKTLKVLYSYLNPVDCYNLALCSGNLASQVKKHKRLKASSIYFRYDDEKSCVGAYFDKYKYTACVFYSWKKDGNRKMWSKSYYLKSHKLQTYLYCKRTQPKEVANMQAGIFQIDCFEGMIEIYRELCSLFYADEATQYVGVNVNDKKSCIALSAQALRKPIYNLRLFGQKPPKPHRMRNLLQSINIAGTVRVSNSVGPACMQDKLINSFFVVLDDPEWITREQLLSINSVTIDIGHNYLTAEDLNAFIMQWMFMDSSETRLEKLEITLSPEAFKNKKAITNGLILHDWDPKQREGEYFEVSYYLNRSSLRDPNHFLDCKFSKDVIREDGRLATVAFYGKKLHFVVWRDRFPYRTLKEARRRQQERKIEAYLSRALHEALRAIEAQAQEEWNQKTEWLEAVIKTRKAAAEEEQTAKRKYFEALQEFLDTSEPKPKRKLLRTITIFKNDIVP